MHVSSVLRYLIPVLASSQNNKVAVLTNLTSILNGVVYAKFNYIV